MLFSPETLGVNPLSSTLVAFLAAFFIMTLIIGIAVYIYTSLAWMAIARKTHFKPAWLAWIPIANLYQRSKIARMHWWPLLLLIAAMIPFIGFIASIAFVVFLVIWNWKAFERIKRPGWWALFAIVPFLGWAIYLVLLGIAAWGKN